MGLINQHLTHDELHNALWGDVNRAKALKELYKTDPTNKEIAYNENGEPGFYSVYNDGWYPIEGWGGRDYTVSDFSVDLANSTLENRLTAEKDPSTFEKYFPTFVKAVAAAIATYGVGAGLGVIGAGAEAGAAGAGAGTAGASGAGLAELSGVGAGTLTAEAGGMGTAMGAGGAGLGSTAGFEGWGGADYLAGTQVDTGGGWLSQIAQTPTPPLNTGTGTKSTGTTTSPKTGGGMDTSSLILQGLTSLAGMGLQTYMSSQALSEMSKASAASGNQLAAAQYAAIAESRRASEQALGYLTETRDLSRADLAPYQAFGKQALDTYGPKILSGPGDYTKSPGYEFRLGEGIKALERGAAAKGGQLSGAQGKALTEYGQNFATADYDNFLNRYYQSMNLGLAGIGIGTGTTSTLASLGANTANQSANLAQQTGTNVSNLTNQGGINQANLTSAAGQNRASAYQQLGNMYTGALNQFETNVRFQNSLASLAQLYGVRS